MKQKTFEEIKEELLLRAKKARACQAGYTMGLRSKSKADILKVITDNWFWLLQTTRIVDTKYLEDNFTEEELAEAGIYTQKCHEARTTSFACGSATVIACGSATVIAYGNATVEACGNSYVEDCIGNIRPQSDYAIVKNCYNCKIYIKKGKYQIIEVD